MNRSLPIRLSHVSIAKNSQNLNVSIYPNPTNSLLYLKNVAKTKLQLIDILGRVIFDKNIEQDNSHIDLSSLVTGIYFVKLKRDNLVAVKKVSYLK